MLLSLFLEEDGVVAIRLTISWDVELDLGKLFSGSSTVGGASAAILMPGEEHAAPGHHVSSSQHHRSGVLNHRATQATQLIAVWTLILTIATVVLIFVGCGIRI